MSYYIQTSVDDMEQIASNGGYGDLIRWVQKLPHQKAPNLRHLVRYGWSDRSREVAAELKACIKQQPPKGYVLETATGLLKIIAGAPNGSVLTITDGLGHDDGKDEE